MDRTRDVDEAILQHALQLLSLVRKQKREVKLDFLEDIPQLLVYLFERITSESIPDELKPFGNVRERAETLQMILDTLEQTLGLSLTHLSGHGLAQLDRRQLSDALEIFGDLVRHCFKSMDENTDRQDDVSDTGRFTRSLLDMSAGVGVARRPDRDIPTPHDDLTTALGGRYGYHDLDKRDFPVYGVDNRHRPEVQRDGWSPVVAIHPLHVTEKQSEENEECALSTNSSTTCLKEIHKGNNSSRALDDKPISLRTTRKPRLMSARKLVGEEERGVWFSPEIATEDTTKNHSNSSNRHNPTGSRHSQDRFVPYRNETSFVRGTHSRQPVKLRKPSVKSFGSNRHVPGTTSGRETTISTSAKETRLGQPSSSRSGQFTSSRSGQFTGSVHQSGNVRTRQTDPKNNKRPPSVTSHKPSARSVDGGQSREPVGRPRRSVSTRSVATAPTTSAVARETSVRYQANSPLPVSGRKRNPSVVSTKVRKHSCNIHVQESPLRRFHQQPSVRRGHVSPQTTSLCSSIKLLEEFDYVRRRLKEIQSLKQEHLEAIKNLDHESARLEAVLLHVHQKSHVKKPDNSTYNRTNSSVGVPV